MLFITWRGFSTRHDAETTEDFFLADRSLSWPLIGLSLFATNISSSSIIGLVSSGYQTGISVFNYEWSGVVMLIIFAVFIVPFYLRYQLTTMPEYLERRFDHRARIYLSVVSITINVIIDIAGALYASSVLLKGIFPEVNLYIFVISMAFITGLYTVSGGLRAVVATDTIQAGLLTLGCAIIAFTVWDKVGGSWHDIKNAIQPGFLSLIRPVDDALIPWPTLLVSLPIMGFYFMCTNQHMVQRVLGARSVDDGRKGALFAGFLKLPLLFLLVLPGTLSRLIYPDVANANLIFPNLMFDFLPVGVLGIVLSGFIAALMSSIDSALTAASSIATIDLYKKFRPESSERHLIRMGKVFILLAVFVASIWAPFIDRFPTLWEYLQAVLSYLTPPVVVCFVFGLFWKRASAAGAFGALLVGGLTGIFLVFNNYFYPLIPPVHYLYSATIIFGVSSGAMILFSYLQPDKKSFESPDQWHKEIPVSGPWYRSYKLYALILFTLTASLVLVFR